MLHNESEADAVPRSTLVREAVAEDCANTFRKIKVRFVPPVTAGTNLETRFIYALPRAI
jgi:hypothetical protein